MLTSPQERNAAEMGGAVIGGTTARSIQSRRRYFGAVSISNRDRRPAL